MSNGKNNSIGGTTSHSSDKNPSSGDPSVNIETPLPQTTASLLKIFQTSVGIIAYPPSSTLQTFRRHLGITAAHTPINGIYKSTLTFERRARRTYLFYRVILSTCVFLQVALGAVLTALGASGASHIVITVVSAVSTMVAGTLALLKSEGMLNRCRSDWVVWKDMRDYIEQRHDEIKGGMWAEYRGLSGAKDGFGGGIVAVWKEIRICEEKYKAKCQTVNNNRPDTYVVVPDSTASHMSTSR